MSQNKNQPAGAKLIRGEDQSKANADSGKLPKAGEEASDGSNSMNSSHDSDYYYEQMKKIYQGAGSSQEQGGPGV